MSLFYKAKCEKEYDKNYLKDSVLLHSGGTSGKSKIIALSNFAINSVSTNTPWIMNWTSFKNKNIFQKALDKLFLLAYNAIIANSQTAKKKMEVFKMKKELNVKKIEQKLYIIAI